MSGLAGILKGLGEGFGILRGRAGFGEILRGCGEGSRRTLRRNGEDLGEL